MNLEKFKPLLAVEADLATLRFPLYASPKLDGIRTVILNGKALTRNLKPIPNHYIRDTLEAYAAILDGMDGELIVGDPTAPNCFNVSSSAIMSRDGEPDFQFHVFDRVGEASYKDRWYLPTDGIAGLLAFIKVVPQWNCESLEELMSIEDEVVSLGYEGIMTRSPEGRYKFGRSTAKEQILLKVKRFEDFEATVVGFEERMHNANEATINALGHTERSSHKANLVGRGDLGALICTHPDYKETFKVGTGFDDATRKEIWDNRDKYMGAFAKIKHQPSGSKDLPRFPVFLGFRDPADM